MRVVRRRYMVTVCDEIRNMVCACGKDKVYSDCVW